VEMRNADRHNGAGGGAPRQAHHVGEKNCDLSALCLHGAFSCKMLDEKICRAVVVTFAVALQQKLLKQALSLFEIARVEPRGKPAVDRSEKLASLSPLAHTAVGHGPMLQGPAEVSRLVHC
jgi:hypothetical protein